MVSSVSLDKRIVWPFCYDTMPWLVCYEREKAIIVSLHTFMLLLMVWNTPGQWVVYITHSGFLCTLIVTYNCLTWHTQRTYFNNIYKRYNRHYESFSWQTMIYVCHDRQSNVLAVADTQQWNENLCLATVVGKFCSAMTWSIESDFQTNQVSTSLLGDASLCGLLMCNGSISLSGLTLYILAHLQDHIVMCYLPSTIIAHNLGISKQ